MFYFTTAACIECDTVLKYFVFAICFTAFSAFAQNASQETTYTINLTKADLSVIERVLEEIPFKIAAPILQKINTQLNTQDQKSGQK